MAAGAAIGTFICPGPGTVVGGIVGMVGGAIGAEMVMAATGLTDALGDYLQPGVETVRRACAFVKEKGTRLSFPGHAAGAAGWLNGLPIRIMQTGKGGKTCLRSQTRADRQQLGIPWLQL